MNGAPPTSAPEAVLARAADLEAGLSVTRAETDEKGFTDALLAELRARRLIWAPATLARGGLGLGLLDCARLVAEVGRISGSAGLILAMHLSQALSLLQHGDQEPYIRKLTDRLIAEQSLVASGTSEKGVGGDVLQSLCTIEALPDGALQLQKDSPNISYMDHAGAALVSARRLSPEGREFQVLIALEASLWDLTPGPAAGFIGMRGILNHPYRLNARFRAEALFPEPYPVIARRTMTPTVHIFWAALWCGIARRALDTVRSFQAKHLGDAEDDAMQRAEFSRLTDLRYAMLALVRDAVAEHEGGLGESLGLARTARVKRLKRVCSELLEEICLGALGLVGLQGYAERGPYSLSEPLRDAISARVMISNYRLLAANAKIERFLTEDL